MNTSTASQRDLQLLNEERDQILSRPSDVHAHSAANSEIASQPETPARPSGTTTPESELSSGAASSGYRSEPESIFFRDITPVALALDAQHFVRRPEDGRRYSLEKVSPLFTDSTGHYHRVFESWLNSKPLVKNSEGDLCIETYLTNSERAWFARLHDAKLGRHHNASGTFSSTRTRRSSDVDLESVATGHQEDTDASISSGLRETDSIAQFQLGDDYSPPTGISKLLQTKIGPWQLYCYLLALGQIMALNSYQITLLAGQIGQSSQRLYGMGSVYVASSISWWILFRKAKSIYSLSLPFLFYGLSFLLVACGPYARSSEATKWLDDLASTSYAVASASGSIFFAQNFGSEGGAPVNMWVFRACAIEGTQQLYIAAMWYWGSVYSKPRLAEALKHTLVAPHSKMLAVGLPVAILFWIMGIALLLGLPSYYRQRPGSIPAFYTGLMRRKNVAVFFIMVIMQNYWLSATNGRNWHHLWNSTHAPDWAVAILVAFFFIGVWGAALYLLSYFSQTHSWLLPIFAVSLGTPRWCQMLWGVSGMGDYVPLGSVVMGALLGRSLWLWLGVLDAIQCVGFGMILLQTLSRFHMAFVLVVGQVVGSLCMMLARATAPSVRNPQRLFPNLAMESSGESGTAWVWLALVCQYFICVAFFWSFRKEQLTKP